MSENNTFPGVKCFLKKTAKLLGPVTSARKMVWTWFSRQKVIGWPIARRSTMQTQTPTRDGSFQNPERSLQSVHSVAKWLWIWRNTMQNIIVGSTNVINARRHLMMGKDWWNMSICITTLWAVMCVEIKWQNTFSGSTNVIFTRRQMTGKNILVTSAAHQKSLTTNMPSATIWTSTLV